MSLSIVIFPIIEIQKVQKLCIYVIYSINIYLKFILYLSNRHAKVTSMYYVESSMTSSRIFRSCYVSNFLYFMFVFITIFFNQSLNNFL